MASVEVFVCGVCGSRPRVEVLWPGSAWGFSFCWHRADEAFWRPEALDASWKGWYGGMSRDLRRGWACLPR